MTERNDIVRPMGLDATKPRPRMMRSRDGTEINDFDEYTTESDASSPAFQLTIEEEITKLRRRTNVHERKHECKTNGITNRLPSEEQIEGVNRWVEEMKHKGKQKEDQKEVPREEIEQMKRELEKSDRNCHCLHVDHFLLQMVEADDMPIGHAKGIDENEGLTLDIASDFRKFDIAVKDEIVAIEAQLDPRKGPQREQ